MDRTQKLKWLPGALSDLARLREFLHVHDPEAAARAAERILGALEKVRKFPLLGRPVEDMEGLNLPHMRDLFVPFGQRGYWLRYALTRDHLLVIGIWHAREERSHGESDNI